jgi:transmembrane sensor
MKRPGPHQPDDALGATAANWVVRRDRGLSAAESVEFELWLAADPRHAAAMSRTTQAWDLLDRIPEHTAHQIAARTTRRRRFWRSFIIGTSLAAAASFAFVFWPESTAPRVATSANEPSPFVPRQLALADGSIVELNRDSEVVAQFTRTERRVILLKGEAYFSVTKDPARPFIVRAGHVDVRAVGTAFNVNLQSAAVEVLVTEGTVKLDPSADGTSRQVPLAAQIPSLVPGQRAVVALKPTAPEVAVVVTTVSQAEMARTMAWQEPLLRLGGRRSPKWQPISSAAPAAGWFWRIPLWADCGSAGDSARTTSRALPACWPQLWRSRWSLWPTANSGCEKDQHRDSGK